MKAMTFAVCTTFVMTSCTNDAEENLPSGNSGTTIINARLAAYESLIQAVDGENDITDVKAFLFRNGKMAKIYELGAPESESYNLQIDNRSVRATFTCWPTRAEPSPPKVWKKLNWMKLTGSKASSTCLPKQNTSSPECWLWKVPKTRQIQLRYR